MSERFFDSKYTEMRGRCIYCVFRAQGTCLLAESVVFPRWGKLTALPKSLSGFERPLRSWEKEGERRKAGEKERKESHRKDGREHPPSSFMALEVTELRNVNAYNWVGEVVNAFFIADERRVDGVDDERGPADNEHDDDEDQRHCDMFLLLVDVALVHRRTVTQVSTVRTDLT